MIGDLTFDKANKNVSLFLYSIVLIDQYGENGALRRNSVPNAFVDIMGSFTGISAYNEGRENRTLYNKSLYTQYYGFLDRYKDGDNKEWIRITPRGKQLLQYIQINPDSQSYEDLYYIPDEYRRQVQELIWDSIVFDPHGKHNSGAQTSKTDIDPPKVFIKILSDIEKATNEELFYVLFSLNNGDNGTLSINKTYNTLIKEVLLNRKENNVSYSEFFNGHGLTNKVSDSKVIDILADPNFEILTKVDEDGVVYNYISDSFKKITSNTNLVTIGSSPLQYIVYANSVDGAENWISYSILGKYGDQNHIVDKLEAGTAHYRQLLHTLSKAKASPSQDFYCLIKANDETELCKLLGDNIKQTTREDNIQSTRFGYTKESQYTTEDTAFTPNFHIIAYIPMSDSITTNSSFDGTFRRIRLEDENVSQTFVPKTNRDDSNWVPGYNKIFYGAPGTGKSHIIDTDYIKSNKSFRITFHPDTDYASFVGCYKPSMGGPKKDQITYSFVPQVFLNAYVYAWNHRDEAVYLVIEELNRGNCAQIFGDIFQLLDRQYSRNAGFSRYTINADTDIANYLSTEISADIEYEEIIKKIYNIDDFDFSIMALPDNLVILATMNTSDQSLFPIDSAFKRRWEMEYVKVDYVDADKFELAIDGTHKYSWGKVLRGLNQYIKCATQSTNKILGNRFVLAKEDKTIDADTFRDKVLFYLFNDVFKDNDEFSSKFFGEDAENMFFEDLCISKDTALINKFIEDICAEEHPTI